MKMKLKMIVVIATLAILGVACNGHYAGSKDQSIDIASALSGEADAVGFHNHGISSADSTSTKTALRADFEFYDLSVDMLTKICLIWVITDANDDVVDSGESCKSWTLMQGSLFPEPYGMDFSQSIIVLIPNSSIPSGGTANAYESYVLFRKNPTGTIHECQYHDPDSSNVYCEGRDANGN